MAKFYTPTENAIYGVSQIVEGVTPAPRALPKFPRFYWDKERTGATDGFDADCTRRFWWLLDTTSRFGVINVNSVHPVEETFSRTLQVAYWGADERTLGAAMTDAKSIVATLNGSVGAANSHIDPLSGVDVCAITAGPDYAIEDADNLLVCTIPVSIRVQHSTA